MNKTLKKILLVGGSVFGAVFGTLVLALAVLIAVIWYRPEVIWEVAEKYFLPPDLKVTWEKLHFDAQMKSLRHWSWTWNIDDLAVVKGSPEVQVGATRVEVQLNVNIATGEPWLEFAELTVLGSKNGHIKILPAPENSEPEENIYQQLQTYLDYASSAQKRMAIRHLNIEVPQLQVISGDAAPMEITALVQKPDLADKAASPDAVRLVVHFKQNELVAEIDGRGDFSSREPKLAAQLSLVEGKNISVKSQLQGTKTAKGFGIDGGAQISYLLKGKSRPLILDPKYKLELSSSAADLSVTTSVRNIPGMFVKLDVVNGEFHLPLAWNETWSKEPLTFKITTGLDLFLVDKNMRKPLEQSCHCKFPEQFATTLEGKAWPLPIFSATKEKQPALDVALKIESVKNKLLDVDAQAMLKADRQGAQWIFDPSTDINLVVHSFQGLKNFLDAKGIIVPAPLDVLEGTITFVSKDKVALEDSGYATHAKCVVDLASKNQKVLIDTTFNFFLAETLRKLNVDIDVLLKKVRLELPPIDPVLGVPAFAKDSRVLGKPKEKTSAGGFKVNIDLRTRTEKPGSVELLSQYAKPFVPLTILASSKGTVSEGEINLEPFSINYLRRVINVEKMKVTLPDEGESDVPLKGRFKMEQGGYKIFIDVTGAMQSPVLTFSSDPYLPRSDIISVLLYGRVNDQLVSGDAETAGRFDAAVTDRAIGLVGLWAFATTPIQSFSYNAVTKVYTATVKLGDGLTAGVGTNWEKTTNLEVRKRLSQRWALTASWSPTETNEERQQGRLVLQWEKRF